MESQFTANLRRLVEDGMWWQEIWVLEPWEDVPAGAREVPLGPGTNLRLAVRYRPGGDDEGFQIADAG